MLKLFSTYIKDFIGHLLGKFELLSNKTRSSTPEAPSRISKMDNLRVRSSTQSASASTFSTTTEPQLAVFETIGASLLYTEQTFSLMNVPSRHSQRTQRLVGKSVHPQRSMGMEELIVQDALVHEVRLS